MKQNRTWIVVADGGQARILIYERPGNGVRQLPDSSFNDPHLPTHELMTDRQPRTQESVGAARHAIEPKTDPHELRKIQFLTLLTEYLELAARRGDFEHLVIVAPATALGELRKSFSPSLSQRLSAEFVHDYVHQSNDYIYQHIREGLPA
jgi:protein required for attachment to host cells